MASTSKLLISVITSVLISLSYCTTQAQSEYLDKDYGTDGIAIIDLPLNFSALSNRDYTVNFDSLGNLYISHFIASGATRRILRLNSLGQVDRSFGEEGYLWESDYHTLHKDNYIFLTKMVENSTLIKVLDLESNLLLKVIVPDIVDIHNLTYEDEGFLVGVTYNLVCFRYNEEGLLDPNFGEGGLVRIIDIPESSLLFTLAQGLVKDSDNTYYIYYTTWENEVYDGVSRIDSNGLEKKYFTEAIIPTFLTENGISQLINTTINKDKSIITSGINRQSNSEERSFHLKIKPDQTVDTNFGDEGLILLSRTSDGNRPSRNIIGQFSNANLAMLGEESESGDDTPHLTDLSILDENGHLITAFGDNGIIPFDDIPDNNILSATIKDNSLYILSYDDSNLRQVHITKINPYENETSITHPQLLPDSYFSLYPNPAHHKTQWLYTGPTLGPTRLSITEQQGQLVKTINLPLLNKDSAININTKNLITGTYLIQLEHEGRLLQTNKLIVQH